MNAGMYAVCTEPARPHSWPLHACSSPSRATRARLSKFVPHWRSHVPARGGRGAGQRAAPRGRLGLGRRGAAVRERGEPGGQRHAAGRQPARACVRAGWRRGRVVGDSGCAQRQGLLCEPLRAAGAGALVMRRSAASCGAVLCCACMWYVCMVVRRARRGSASCARPSPSHGASQ